MTPPNQLAAPAMPSASVVDVLAEAQLATALHPNFQPFRRGRQHEQKWQSDPSAAVETS